MQHLLWEVDTSPDSVVVVSLNRQANVRVMDMSNYNSYRQGRSHRYYGGHAKMSPVKIPVPYAGHWYVVVDLGGYSGNVHASVQVFN